MVLVLLGMGYEVADHVHYLSGILTTSSQKGYVKNTHGWRISGHA
jgi:hypothetical protein